MSYLIKLKKKVNDSGENNFISALFCRKCCKEVDSEEHICEQLASTSTQALEWEIVRPESSTNPDENEPVLDCEIPGPSSKKRKFTQKEKELPCPFDGCMKIFYLYKQRETHIETSHQCSLCGYQDTEIKDHECVPDQYGGGVEQGDEQDTPLNLSTSFKLDSQVHRGQVRIYKREIKEEIISIDDLFQLTKDELIHIIKSYFNNRVALKISLRLVVDMKEKLSGNVKTDRIISSGTWVRVNHVNFCEASLIQCFQYLIMTFTFLNSENGSEWVVTKFSRIDLQVGKYEINPPGKGKVLLPAALKHRKGMLNFDSSDLNDCFMLCILANFYIDEIWDEYAKEKNLLHDKVRIRNLKFKVMRNSKLVRSKKAESKINFNCLNLQSKNGVSVEDLDIFEKMNEISITVYTIDSNSKVNPYRYPKKLMKKHVDLLLVVDGESSHWILIKDKSAFFGHINEPKHFFCRLCEARFITKSVYESHENTCMAEGGGKVVKKDPKRDAAELKNKSIILPIPYNFYMTIHNTISTLEDEKISFEPTAACISVYQYTSLLRNIFFCEENLYVKIIKMLDELSTEYIEEVKNVNKPIIMRKKDEENFKNATKCYLCKMEFSDTDPKCRHHSHYSGYYHGALHTYKCNPFVTYPNYINCISYNASKYLPNLLSVGFKNDLIFHSFPIISKNGDMIGCMINKKFRILDFSNFFPDCSLEDAFKGTYNVTRNDMESIIYLNGLQKLTEKYLLQNDLDFYVKNIPEFPHKLINLDTEEKIARDCFSDIYYLTDKKEEKYEIYKKTISKSNKIKTRRDFLKFVLSFKTCVVGDVVNCLRFIIGNYTRCEMLYSWTLNSLAMDILLRTGLRIHYISDFRIREMVENLVRGPILHLSQRHAKANFPLYENYDNTLPNSIIVSMDIRSCFGWCMRQANAISDYRMMDDYELAQFDFANPDESSGRGYCFKVDLILPQHLHSEFSDFPLWPESYKVKSKNINQREEDNENINTSRLLLSLRPKVGRVYYYKSLAFLLKKGYILDKIHAGFSFVEEKYMENYANLFLGLRNHFTDDFYKNIMKLFVNVISGKMAVDPLSYSRLEYCFTAVRANDLLKKDTFQNVNILGPNTSLFQLKKKTGADETLKLQAGIIYELSKLRLYTLYYDYIKPIFKNNINVIQSNTDSLIIKYTFQNYDYIDKFKQLSPIMDYSNLDVNDWWLGRHIYNTNNKNKAGYMRIQDSKIIEFIGSRPVCYSVLSHNDLEKSVVRKMSGIPNSEQEKLDHEKFKKMVLNSDEFKYTINYTKFKKNYIYLKKNKKSSFMYQDNSRVWISNQKSIALGHHKIDDMLMDEKNLNYFKLFENFLQNSDIEISK